MGVRRRVKDEEERELRGRRLEFGEGGKEGEEQETAKKGRIEKKNSDRGGAVVHSGVRLWNSISWSVDRSPRW